MMYELNKIKFGFRLSSINKRIVQSTSVKHNISHNLGVKASKG
jgi:hypothetical protein